MAEHNLLKIKSIYGEVKGILEGLPKSPSVVVPISVGNFYNNIVDDLNNISGSDYSRLKLTPADEIEFTAGQYDATAVRVKVGSLVRKLEEEYTLGRSSGVEKSPIIVTVNQNQQVTITVTPITEIINNTYDELIKADLEELDEAIKTTKDPSEVSTILGSIMQKSWEVFIKVLPYVLEKMG